MMSNLLTPKFQRLITIANSYVGTVSSSLTPNPQVAQFREVLGNPDNGQSWCMDFVLFCINQVETEFSQPAYLFKSQSVLEVWNKSPKMIRLEAPTPGSIMIWQMWKDNKPTVFGHTGIVCAVSEVGFVDTIEGNTSAPSDADQIDRQGNGVWVKKRTLKGSSSMRVCGWLLPWV